MHAARFAETDRPAQRRRAGQMHFARSQNDRFVKRPVVEAVALADVDAQGSRFLWDVHYPTFLPARLAAKAHCRKNADVCRMIIRIFSG